MKYLLFGTHFKRRGFEKSNYGVWIAERPTDITYIRCRNADYLNGLNRLIQSVNTETVFIDIGANIGIFSLIAGRNRNFSAVHSFEPSKPSYDLLHLNATQNASSKIKTYQYAIGPITQETHLSVFKGHSGRSAVLGKEDSDAETIQMINEVTLNVFFADIECPVFVKIDVEGFELQVLETLQKTPLFQRVEHMHIEFDVSTGQLQEVQSLLECANFVEVKRWGDNNHWDSYWIRKGVRPLKYRR